MEQRKTVIVGSGPAGLTAAIYTARADLNPIVIEGSSAGGQLMTTTEIENFPGFPDGITGPELMANMRQQAEKFGTDFLSGDVTKADLSSRPFTISVGEKEIKANTLIIATGATARYLDIDSVQQLRGKGISACATCDGFFFRNKIVFVIGGGDSAMEEAIFLTKFASKVYIVHRREELRASKIMQQNAQENEKIEFILNATVVEALGVEEGHVTGIKLKNLKTDEIKEYQADGIFFAIGHNPNTEVFRDFLPIDESGYLVRQPSRTATNVEGVFSAGDVGDNFYRQAITAAGEGCKAALEAEKFLVEKNEL